MKRWPCCICETEESHQPADLELQIGPKDFNDGSRVPPPRKHEPPTPLPQIDVPTISLGEIKEKTDGFSSKSLVSEGSYGRVYYTTLNNGKEVAIKKLDVTSEPEPNNDFLAQKGVQDAQPGPTLNWMQRLWIAVDAARGLEYLHEKVHPSVLHQDIRSSNVLLFDDFKAKIADFNVSNQSPDMAACLHSTRVLGTFGYHTLEYAMTGQLTQKSDVYIFGVVILELLTCRKPVDHPEGSKVLLHGQHRD